VPVLSVAHEKKAGGSLLSATSARERRHDGGRGLFVAVSGAGVGVAVGGKSAAFVAMEGGIVRGGRAGAEKTSEVRRDRG